MVHQCFGDCGCSSIRVEPDISTNLEQDYWEEVANVQNAFIADPSLAVSKQTTTRKQSRKPNSIDPNEKGENIINLVNGDTSAPSELAPVDGTDNQTKIDQNIDALVDKVDNNSNQTQIELQSTELNTGDQHSLKVDKKSDEQSGYCFCFCCRTGTPCSVWIFIGCSIIFFKMGTIVTGRWIYLWQSSFDEFAFYAAFTLNLGFGTFYFRHGTKHHHPFDLLFLIVTLPLMCGLLTFTTVFFKQDMFFYVASGFYSTLVVPYTVIGSFITYKFWTSGKLFSKRVEGDKELEPLCRNLFFATSFLVFDMQATISASIISMAPSVNHTHTVVWISSLIFGPLSIVVTITWFIIGYLAMRRENMILTWIFTIMSGNSLFLVISMLLKMPAATELRTIFINILMTLSIIILSAVHVCVLVFIWSRIVPAYGKGLRKALSRTKENSCIQFAEITICK